MALMITSEDMFRTEVLESDKPVLVDFFATWCGPCKMLAPVVEEIAAEKAGQVKVVKLDVDEVGGVAMDYGVMSIPTLIYFKNGEAVETMVGFRPKEAILDILN
ncbi:MAG: thioredoxin [Oscillospiraceae bacterium]|nr:thioredoxin [Oscillospiraceae bacterium]